MGSLCLIEDGNSRKRSDNGELCSSRRINNGDNNSNPKRRRLCYCINSEISSSIEGLSGLSGCSESESESELSGLDKLTPDLFLDILIRLPLNMINCCKSVSKAWRSLISAPVFAHSYNHLLSADNNTPLLFRIEQSLRGVSQVYTVPFSATPDASALPFTFDFIPPLRPLDKNACVAPSPFGTVQPVLVDTHFKASHGGLILLQGVFCDQTYDVPYYRNVPYVHNYLCCPVTKQWLQLPFISTPPDFSLIGFACYTLQAPYSRIWADDVNNPDFNPNMIDFTVISVTSDENAHAFIVHLFCSEVEVKIPRWVKFRVPCPCGYTWIEKVNVVFFNGKFYWCGKECIIVYDPFNNPRKCSAISLPHNYCTESGLYNFSLHATQGHLRLVISQFQTIFIWELAGHANKSWVNKFKRQMSTHYGLTDSSFGDKIYLIQRSSTILLYDMGNASLQHVYTCPIPLNRGSKLQFFGPLLSRPWPTLLPIHKFKQVISSH